MNKYNDEQILRISAIFSVIMAVAIIVLLLGNKTTGEKRVAANEDIEKVTIQNIGSGKVEDKIEEKTEEKTQIQIDPKDKLIIPLTDAMEEKNVDIKQDVYNGVVNISFETADGGYDISEVVNNSSYVGNIAYAYDAGKMNVSVTLNEVVAYDKCIANGILYIEFYEPMNKKDSIVVIDAGHGGSDAGAIRGDFYEKDLDINVAEKIKELFDGKNVAVFLTRTGDDYTSVGQRVNFVNNLKPDLFVSVHANWYDNNESCGISVLYNAKDESQFSSKWFSEIVDENVVKKTGLDDRGAIKGNDIHIVRNSQVPVALVEMGFISNDTDFALLSTEDGRKAMAEGIYNGIAQALKEMGKPIE